MQNSPLSNKSVSICLNCFKIPLVTFKDKDIEINCSCGETNKLPIKDYLTQINSFFSPNTKCNKHQKEKAISYCFNCKIGMCSNCNNSHKQSNGDHKTTEDIKTIIPQCETHSSEREFYCTNCDDYFCGECKESHDNNHSYINLITLSSIIQIDQLKKKMKDGEEYLNKYYPKLLNDYIQLVKEEYSNGLERNKNILQLIYILTKNYSAPKINNYNLLLNLSHVDFNFIQLKDQEEFIPFMRKNTIFKYISQQIQIIEQKDNHFNLESRQPIKTIDNYSFVYSFILLKDGRLAFNSYSDIIILNPNEYYHCDLKIKTDHTKCIYSICELEDNKLISCSSDNTIKIWEINKENNYQCLTTLTEHTDSVYKVMCLPDNRIISGSHDKLIKVWESVAPFECKNTIKGHTDSVASMLIMNDNNSLVSGGYKELGVWNINTFENEKMIDAGCSRVNNLIKIDESKLAVCYTKTLKILDILKGEIEKEIEIDSIENIRCILLLKDGNILCGGKRGSFFLFELDKEEIKKRESCHIGRIDSLIILNDNILSSGYDDKIKIWK